MQPSITSPFTQLKIDWLRLSIAQRGTIALLIPLLCLVASFTAYLGMRQKGIEVRQQVDHSQMVLLETHGLFVDMLNIETGVRGYYIGHQPEFLEPYRQGATSIATTFSRLRRLLQDNPDQTQALTKLETLSNQQLDLLKASIQEVDRFSPNPTPSTVLQPYLTQGQAVMDRFRTDLTALEAEQQRLLSKRQQRLAWQIQFNTFILLAGIIVSSSGSAIAINLFKNLSQELRDREVLLQEVHNLIRAVFANMVDAVVILNPRGEIESLNRAAEQMFGYPVGELIERDWMLLLALDADGHPNADPKLDLLPAEPWPTDRVWQATGQRYDGTCFPVEVLVSAIELDHRHIVIIRDVSERQQAATKLQARADELAALNDQLLATNAMLSERNRELDQFAYVVSHDLKAPLRAISSLSTWIEEDLPEQLPDESQKHMKLLRGRLHRMEALLNGLLEYTRIGRTEIAIESIDVAVVLDNVIRDLVPPPDFRIEIGAPMPRLRGRKLLLEQVFKHLIANAIDHHPSPQGHVTISVEDQGQFYEFAIADDGKGIDPRFHDKIYVIFQTLQARDTHERKGVGLAIVKKIVDMEGGEISLKSAIGNGTTFRFTWPKQPLPSPKAV